jgi:hypothetical protein
MTHPAGQPDSGARAYTHWTPAEWIDEAISQYGQSRAMMTAWAGMPVGSAEETATYKCAANHAQSANAAAAIAAVKLGWDMTDG